MKPLSTPPKLVPVLGPNDLPVEHLVIKDDTPVDNILSEKEQRLLVDPLHASWKGPGEGRPFLPLANVGLFYSPQDPPVVPDFMLSLDVQVAANMREKKNQSYFTWVFGKLPEVVIEIVSNQEGGEADRKLELYAQLGIRYYIIHDPEEYLGIGVLRVQQLRGRTYKQIPGDWLTGIGLGLTLWQGPFENMEAQWLRWCDRRGRILPTGAERVERERQRSKKITQRARQETQRAEQETRRAEQETRRAEQEEQRAELEKRRADRLAEKLRQLGFEPEA